MVDYSEEQAGTGPSRRHIQGSKIAKTSKCQVFSFTVLENRKFFEKNWTERRAELANASPWRAKVSQCRKTERGDPLSFFNIHSVAKHEKIEQNKKVLFS